MTGGRLRIGMGEPGLKVAAAMESQDGGPPVGLHSFLVPVMQAFGWYLVLIR